MEKCCVLFEVGTEFFKCYFFEGRAPHAALPILNSSKLPPVVDAADLIVF
jgi:hypothetical protein